MYLKLFLAALIDSEQMLLSIKAQLCTRGECFDHKDLCQLQCICSEYMYLLGSRNGD